MSSASKKSALISPHKKMISTLITIFSILPNAETRGQTGTVILGPP